MEKVTDGLADLASRLVKNGPDKMALGNRRVRAQFNGKIIVDTLNPRHVWEHQYYPQHYLPIEDFKDIPVKGKAFESSNSAFSGTLKIGDRETDRVILFEKGELKGLVKLDFAAMDAWYEEEVEIFVHPKDPFKRIEMLPSSRHIRVAIDGKTVAETNQAVMLLETLLPVRYYLPKISVLDWNLLSESDLTMQCPYKGISFWYNVTVNGKEHKDAIWWYRSTTHEASPIAGRICFYNEKVDIWIDGVLQERPKTQFS